MSGNEEKRVAIYTRVARNDRFSIENQESVLREYAARQGCTDPLIYADNGESGLTLRRPAFMKLDRDIRDGKIEKVIAANVSRIGRDAVQVMEWLGGLREKGIEFEAALQPNPIEMPAAIAFHKMIRDMAVPPTKQRTGRERER
jgi:DNA invertase Pin-like site-specific DNA recombinase